MCGIFGAILIPGNQNHRVESVRALIHGLFLYSESRGKEAAGIAIHTARSLHVFRDSLPASCMIKTPAYQTCESAALEESYSDGYLVTPLAFVGHSRLVTNGLQGIDENNQPVVKAGTAVVHNGIVVNDSAIWADYPELTRTAQVDTEAIVALINKYLHNGCGVKEATIQLFHTIEGETSIGTLFADRDVMLLATNTGSLYYSVSHRGDALFFASERYIVRRLQAESSIISGFSNQPVHQVQAGLGLVLSIPDLRRCEFPLKTGSGDRLSDREAITSTRQIFDKNVMAARRLAELRRCKRCVLPETMPYITFNPDGVCNYCFGYKPHLLKGREALEEILVRFRSKTGDPDCLVAFSGGRDSSFALHLLKRELSMNPVAYTYDWGMVTDVARRNQARLCGKLGIEHIWVSADIKAKRRNIKRNVEAWMRRPNLGMVPLFMAGDKQFFHYGHQVLRQTGIELLVFATNHFEKTDFKIGFCGISPMEDNRPNRLSFDRKLRLAFYYGAQFLRNPAYLNRSLLDTVHAFVSYYVMDNETTILHLFDYVEWNEAVIDRILIQEYDWEIAKDIPSTWRIGDGTAAMYNFVYRTIAGFSEHETFRSNQIREGVITREQGLRLLDREKQHRYDSIREYCHLVGVDFDELLRVVNATEKRY